MIEVADQIGLPKHRLAEISIEAAVDAIEKNGYRLVLPVEFTVTRVAVEKTSSNSRYPSNPDEGLILNEQPAKKKIA